MRWIKFPLVLGTALLLGLTLSLVVSGGAAQAVEIEAVNERDEMGEDLSGREKNKSISDNQTTVNSSYFNVSRLSEPEYRIFDEGFEAGFQRGNATGYSQGFIDGYMKNPGTPEYYPEAETSQREEIIERDGYTFIFGEVKSDYVGMSWPENNTVKIEISSVETAGELETLCDHEMAHQFFPDFEHSTFDARENDPIYSYSDDMDIETCDWLTKELSVAGSVE